jgi:acid stress-induced BolA-like protein IbaG/YrbA
VGAVFGAIPPEFSLNPADVQQLIATGLPGAEISVTSDDGTHFEARIVSELFAGKRPLARHQLVYAALGPRMGREIHALSMRTLTPEEARQDTG